MEIGHDPTCGAEQKGGTFGKSIFNYFHKYKHLGDHPFEIDRSEASITKRYGTTSSCLVGEQEKDDL
jgi:hypothetical protein